jgi:hypothetical protein
MSDDDEAIRSVHWTYSLSNFLWLEQVEQVVLS